MSFDNADFLTYAFALVIGFFIVWARGGDKFDEPEYIQRFSGEKGKDKNTGQWHYKKYIPRFTAIKKRYSRSKGCYILILLLIYSGVSLIPGANEIFYKFLPNLTSDKWALFPLTTALIIIGVHDVRQVEWVTKWFREKLYRWARIPVGVRDTVRSLQSVDFNFEPYLRVGDFKNKIQEFTEVIEGDISAHWESLEHKWAKASCIVYSLRQARIGNFSVNENFTYEPDIFEEYYFEYEEVVRLHGSLWQAIKVYRELRKNGDPKKQKEADSLQITINEDIDSLLERANTFLVCAVKPKQKDEAGVVESLNAVGYRLPSPFGGDVNPLTFLIAALVLLLAIALIVGASATDWFEGYVGHGFTVSELDHFRYPYVPHNVGQAILWGVASVLFYCGAAYAALRYRGRKIRKKEWWEDAHRERPVNNYLKASLFGGFVGIFFLLILSLPLLYEHKELVDGKIFFFRNLALVPWILVSGMTAFFTVFHHDTSTIEPNRKSSFLWVGIQGLLAGSLAFGASYIYATWLKPAKFHSSHESNFTHPMRV